MLGRREQPFRDLIAMATAEATPIISWAALPDDVLRACFRSFAVRDLLSVGASCKAWQQVADGNGLWSPACIDRWAETAGLRRVGSYKALYRRMAKADRRVALREAPGALQFMVRLRMEGAVVMAHTFTWSEADGDGTWACPPLAIPPALLQRAASDFASRDLTCFKDFAEWFSSDVTVTAYRELDGRIARLLPETPPELPSEFCCEADYANKVTFTGFEERCANTSLVLGAQFNTTGTLPDLSDSDAFVSVARTDNAFPTRPFFASLRLLAWFVFFFPPPHPHT